MSVQPLKTREQVEEQYTWDLTPIFADDAAFEVEFARVSDSLQELSVFQGKLGESADTLADALDLQTSLSRKVHQLYVYCHLKSDQDQTNTTYQPMHARAVQLYGKLAEVTAYLTPELLAIPEATIAQFIETNERLQGYRQFLDDILRK